MGPKKQKRELPEDFDPVYPYDVPQLQINPPFVSGDGFHQSVDGVLSLHIAPPLIFDNTRALTLAFGGGLQLSGKQLVIATEGSGLTTNAEGKLVLQVSSPLTLSGEGISLSLGPGLSSTEAGLSLQVTSPLQLQGSALSLPLGAGLQQNTEGGMTVKLGSGLTTDNNQAVTVRVGKGLQLNEGQLTVPATAPLVSDTTGISFNYSPTDFALDNDSLSLKPKPISVTAPLQSTQNTISLKYSTTDFSVDSNDTLTLAPAFRTYTLWTGNSSTPNVTLTDNTTLNGTFFLCLTRVGGLVLGSFALKSSSIQFTGMTKKVNFIFNNVGQLQTKSTYKGNFGFRSNNSVIDPAAAGLSPAWLMPSTLIYPASTGSSLTSFVYINQSYVHANIKVNTLSTDGYSLEFHFENMSFSAPFSTSYGTFCYVPQSA